MSHDGIKKFHIHVLVIQTEGIVLEIVDKIHHTAVLKVVFSETKQVVPLDDLHQLVFTVLLHSQRIFSGCLRVADNE